MKKYFALLAAAFLAFIPFSAYTVKAEVQKLVVYNWEDYVYENDDKTDLYDDYEKWYKTNYGKEVKVEHTEFGTNEIMYNELKINKNGNDYNCDLVCPSDYMMQKMLNEDMLEKIGQIQNYNNYASGYLINLFTKNGWADYSIGYMWGTMGYVYNPEFVAQSDIKSWAAIWNIDYQNKSTIKDSIRDTYFLGVAYVYRDELNELKSQLSAEEINESEYAEKLSEIFHRTDSETIAKVEKALTNVKANLFSFELDEGKNDMVTGKININFAWSGDAVFAMDEAENDNVELYYSVPEEASNIWFDGWVMPKGADIELAKSFLEFISLPETAIKNMEYIGYTSAIAGDDVYDWVKENYTAENNAEEIYNVDLTYFFDNITGERDGHIVTDTIGRQFSAMYPEKETIQRCTIMKTFDDETLQTLNSMWERVKGKTLSIWVIIIILVIFAAALGITAFVIFKKKRFTKRKSKYTVVKKG